MKKMYLTLPLFALMVACGSGTEKKEEAGKATTEVVDLSSNPDYQKGLELVGKSDCLTCHKVSEKNIGPAYKDVAAKYENTDENVKMLATKIIKGGQGVWGAIPMTPHSSLSEANAEQMVKYILLLKK